MSVSLFTFQATQDALSSQAAQHNAGSLVFACVLRMTDADKHNLSRVAQVPGAA